MRISRIRLLSATPLEGEHRRLYVEPAPGVNLSMHAKVLVADRRRALIGSANFTLRGLGSNIELGLLIEGDICEQVCLAVESMRDEGWFVRVG